jgi:hypothetical protein
MLAGTDFACLGTATAFSLGTLSSGLEPLSLVFDRNKSPSLVFSRDREKTMDNGQAASDSAWSTYLLLHREVDENDYRRLALRLYVANLCDAGEQNPDALQTAGLAYLRKLDKRGEQHTEQLARYKTLQA